MSNIDSSVVPVSVTEVIWNLRVLLKNRDTTVEQIKEAASLIDYSIPTLTKYYYKYLNHEDLAFLDERSWRIGALIKSATATNALKIIEYCINLLEVYTRAIHRSIDKNIYTYYERVPIAEAIEKLRSEQNQYDKHAMLDRASWAFAYGFVFLNEYSDDLRIDERKKVLLNLKCGQRVFKDKFSVANRTIEQDMCDVYNYFLTAYDVFQIVENRKKDV